MPTCRGLAKPREIHVAAGFLLRHEPPPVVYVELLRSDELADEQLDNRSAHLRGRQCPSAGADRDVRDGDRRFRRVLRPRRRRTHGEYGDDDRCYPTFASHSTSRYER